MSEHKMFKQGIRYPSVLVQFHNLCKSMTQPLLRNLALLCEERNLKLIANLHENIIPEQCFCVWSENESDFANRAFMCDLTCMCIFMTPHDFYTLTSLIGEEE